MKIFDGHTDIWYDVSEKRKHGKENVFLTDHLDRFKKGKVMGGIFIAYLDKKYQENAEREFTYLLTSTMHEILKNQEIFNIIKKKGDFNKGLVNEKINILMGVEGLRAIKDNLDWLDLLYGLGFRHASLTWNEENMLATGVAGDETRGLTLLGKEAIKKMDNLGMIIDCSHANEKTFWDIFETTENPFIASHSNVMRLCEHRRNLTDEQIKAIGKKEGLVGINAYKHFVTKESEKQNLESYVNHIEYIVDMIGINHVGLGFDFCEFLPGEKDCNPRGLEDASCAYRVIEELYKRGYRERDVRKIAYENFMRIIEKIIK